jgi:hypothetical protein
MPLRGHQDASRAPSRAVNGAAKPLLSSAAGTLGPEALAQTGSPCRAGDVAC